jgi:hypothetical protein
MVYKQAWSIKNYRYVGDVEPNPDDLLPLSYGDLFMMCCTFESHHNMVVKHFRLDHYQGLLKE